jgi:hypothetical protein
VPRAGRWADWFEVTQYCEQLYAISNHRSGFALHLRATLCYFQPSEWICPLPPSNFRCFHSNGRDKSNGSRPQGSPHRPKAPKSISPYGRRPNLCANPIWRQPAPPHGELTYDTYPSSCHHFLPQDSGRLHKDTTIDQAHIRLGQESDKKRHTWANDHLGPSLPHWPTQAGVECIVTFE